MHSYQMWVLVASMHTEPPYSSCKQNQLSVQIFLICLQLFCTCFGQLCAHHQEKISYICDTWYQSIYIDDCLVCRAAFLPPCIPNSHLYRVTNTRCSIGKVFSPDDSHIFVRNVQRKTINILRKYVHQVGSIYKIIKGCRSTKLKKNLTLQSTVHNYEP